MVGINVCLLSSLLIICCDGYDRMVEKICVHNSLVDSIVLVPRLYYY